VLAHDYDDPSAHPNSARIYDYLLGGSNNFGPDREAARRIVAGQPDMPLIAYANRSFLRRAVRFVAEQGIQQYLDLGSGIPTVGNVHEVARQTLPDARIVYVDIDPITVAHASRLVRDQPGVIAVRGDLRHPEAVLANGEVRSMLRIAEPMTVLMLASLHFVLDDAEAISITSTLRDAMAPGSYLVITHASYDYLPDDQRRDMETLSLAANIPLRVRTRDEILRYFDGLELVEPGLVYPPLWRPESADDVFMDDPPRAGVYAGVGRRAG
jgi:S-adenosyl methyltransferase